MDLSVEWLQSLASLWFLTSVKYSAIALQINSCWLPLYVSSKILIFIRVKQQENETIWYEFCPCARVSNNSVLSLRSLVITLWNICCPRTHPSSWEAHSWWIWKWAGGRLGWTFVIFNNHVINHMMLLTTCGMLDSLWLRAARSFTWNVSFVQARLSVARSTWGDLVC